MCGRNWPKKKLITQLLLNPKLQTQSRAKTLTKKWFQPWCLLNAWRWTTHYDWNWQTTKVWKTNMHNPLVTNCKNEKPCPAKVLWQVAKTRNLWQARTCKCENKRNQQIEMQQQRMNKKRMEKRKTLECDVYWWQRHVLKCY